MSSEVTTDPMTKEKCLEKFDELMADMNRWSREKIINYLNSGSIDLGNYPNNYLLPKILLAALGTEITWQYLPCDRQDQKTVYNLRFF